MTLLSCMAYTLFAIILHATNSSYTVQILNLKQLHVHCGKAAVLLTQSYEEFLVHQATGGIPGFTTPKHPLVFFGGDIVQKTVYIFLPKYVLRQS